MLRRYWPFSLLQSRSLRTAKGNRRAQRLGMVLEGLLLMLGFWAALILRLPDNYNLEVGRPSAYNIVAPSSVEFISTVRTNERRSQVENQPSNVVYTTDRSLPLQQRTQLDQLLATVSQVRNDPLLSQNERITRLVNLPSASVAVTPELAERVVKLDDDTWNSIRVQSLALYDRALADTNYTLDQERLKQVRDLSLPYWASTVARTPETVDMLVFFTTSFLKVNSVVDEAATEAQREQARAAVEPVKLTVQQGESIIREGEIVTPETIEKLEATGEVSRSLNWYAIGGRGLLAGLLALAFMLYLRFFQPEVVQQLRSLLVLVLLMVTTALGARLLFPLVESYTYAFPLATLALVLTVVYNGRLALAGTVLLAVVIGLIDNNNAPLMVTLMLGSTAGVLVARQAERLRTFLLAGLAVGLATIVVQLGFWLTSIGTFGMEDALRTVLPLLAAGLVNGVLSAVLALGLFNLVGQAAGVVTVLQLMELAHPNQPLLRKLMQEAPGTYYHSVAVGNLAEAAAEAVGADALLLRVAAYYHDIGKTIRPYFFTDNQTGRENIHNDLDPRISAQIIVDHVREGIKMARSAGLPPQIVDFIASHHGTHLIKHFYQQALQKHDSVNISDFRYPGPKPVTREQGILMLADSVEATVRSKAQNGKLLPTRSGETAYVNGNGAMGSSTVEELIASIIDERVRDGQLDETPLTLRDLVLIRQTFVTSLQSIYHPRVDYSPQGVAR
ncbi:MAG: HDIG domain-containing protein [Chloroflexaceae bacterium]|jgi:hypothetical protein|nr:HDIG domain-containing protein [Chloroflexaceae bacterium]